MNDPFVLVGAVLGLALLVAYLLKKRGTANVLDGVSLVSAGVGCLAGVKLCCFSYLYRDVSPLREVSVQTLLGGVAVVWVSVTAAAKKFSA